MQQKKEASKSRDQSKEPSTLSFKRSAFVVLVLGIIYSYLPKAAELTHQETQEILFSNAVKHLKTNSSALVDSQALSNGQLVNKYKSDLVHIDPQQFLEPMDCSTQLFSFGERQAVLPIMQLPVGALRKKDQIFIMLNGESEGMLFSWSGEAECLHRLAHTAAIQLGAHPDRVSNGVRLVTQYSLPITSVAEVEAANRIVHVLLDFQLWVWPGIAINHTFNVDGVVLTTKSLSPLVFSVSNFFTKAEAEEIIARGSPGLARSVVGESVSGEISDIRTSHTAFLPDSAFTRDFQHRSAKLARLPSPSFAERLQLVRYRHGEFYRKHQDTMMSKNILLPAQFTYSDYTKWAKWAMNKLDELDDNVPSGFRKGELYYPNPKDFKNFPNALLQLFLDQNPHYFTSRNESQWQQWIEERLLHKAPGTMRQLLKPDQMPSLLPLLVQAWEKAIQRHALHYVFPSSKFANGMSQFLRWIRWVKEKVSALGVDTLPKHVRPWGKNYPQFSEHFQYRLLAIFEKQYTSAEIKELLGQQWFDFLMQYKTRRDAIHILIQNVPDMVTWLISAWEREVNVESLVYTMPKYSKHTNPNRFVTLFLYLNDVTSGGETVFPHAAIPNSKSSSSILDECTKGFSVPATGLGAALFYVQTPDQELDFLSEHGGCPPGEGQVKWGSNSFMWNDDALEGTNFWE